MTKKIEPLYEQVASSNVDELIKLFSDKHDLMVLTSSMQMEGYGRYSFICFDSFWSFSSKGKCNQNPFDEITEKLNEFKVKHIDGLPPLQGGAVGYFGYEAGHYLEELPDVVDHIKLPDIYLNFYSSVISIDHATNQCWVVATGFPEKSEGARLKKAKEDIIAIKKKCRLGLGQTIASHNQPCWAKAKPTSNFTRESYVNAVNITKHYILNGDIFEANISQQFNATLPDNTNLLDLYFSLMTINPAPFSAFITLPEQGYIISASPERFIKLTNQGLDRHSDHRIPAASTAGPIDLATNLDPGFRREFDQSNSGRNDGQCPNQLVETCPIKGTRKRSSDRLEDERLANELINCEKDHAENVMIVDLMRNDLSRVCQSVNVEELCALKSFETVHHLVSKVTGILKNNQTAIDLIKASFPPGSVTGAPKIRAMEIISELEQQTRGPYCGSLGYLSFTGDMDLSVIIRTYFINKNKLFFSAGGAIVLDSNPDDEYQESLTKAAALIKAISL